MCFSWFSYCLPSKLTLFCMRDMRSAPRDVEDFEFDAAAGPIWNRFKVLHHFPCETCRSRYSLISGGSRWKKQATMINTLAPPPQICFQICKIFKFRTSDFQKSKNDGNPRRAAKPMPIDAEWVGLSFARTFSFQSLPSNEKNEFLVSQVVSSRKKWFRAILSAFLCSYTMTVCQNRVYDMADLMIPPASSGTFE